MGTSTIFGRLGGHRAARSLAIAGIAAFAWGAPSPVGGDDPWHETGEWWPSPVRGVPHRFLRHQDSGEKVLIAPDGRRFASMDDAARAEAAGLARAEIVVGARLREAALDPERADRPVPVVFVLGTQPLHEAGEAARRRHAATFAALLREHRAILAGISPRRAADPGRTLQVGQRADEERALLAEPERERIRALRDQTLSLRRAMRREILDEARPRVEAEQAPVAAWLEARGAAVLARAVGLNCVTALVSPRTALDAVEALPRIHGAELSGVRTTGNNVSIPTIGASSWTSNSYDGSSSTKVCVLDTGIDDTHPALDNGIVTDKAVYLAVGSQSGGFADNANSTDDLHGHGTHIGGTLMSTDSTLGGIAQGGALMNGKCGFLVSGGGGSLADPDIMDAGDWAADNGADVLNCSFGGGGTTNGSDPLTLFFDAMIHDLNLSVAISAGNSGSGSGTVGIPGDGFNCLTVGAFSDNGTTQHDDNSLASFSSRGPLSDNRRKPDLSGPGVLINSCAHNWEGGNSDFVQFNGTSMSAPHVAGSLLLLEDFAASWAPESMKALLINSVRNTSPYPTTPDDDWGYGGLDLSLAYTNRACVIEGSLSSSGAAFEFFKAPSLASGGRTTLVWNRQVVSNGDSAPSTFRSLADLDLYLYDEADGSSEGSSTSSLNSVEQVKLASALSAPVIKVKRPGSLPSGVSTQDFAVASETSGALTSTAPPALACVYTVAPDLLRGSQDFTLTVRVDNSGGLPAFAPSVSLTLPSGYSVESGSNPQALSAIDDGASGTATWTVRSASSGSSGARTLRVAATSSSYGESFASANSDSEHDLDLAAPSGSVVVESVLGFVGSTAVNLLLSATDDLSGVSEMRFSNDGTNFTSWEPFDDTKSWTLAAGSDGDRTVSVQYRDAAGNESGSFTDDVALDTTAPSGTILLADGAAWTTQALVPVSASATDAGSGSGVAEMRFGTNGTDFGNWEPYSDFALFLLPDADGARTVHAQFRDLAGNVSTGSIFDGIGLDRVAPAGSVVVAGGAVFTVSTSVNLALAATDATSGVSQMRFSNDGVSFGSFANFAASASHTLASPDGTKVVHVQFSDVAGNVSTAVTDGITLDGTAPTAGIVIAGNAIATASTSVTLTLSSTDSTAGVSQMRFRNGTDPFTAWEAFSTTKSWTLPSGDATRFVGVQFNDGAGNVSGTATDSIFLDQTPPTASVGILNGAAATSDSDVVVDAGWSDNLSGVFAIRLSNDGITWSGWLEPQSTVDWTLAPGEGLRSVFLQSRDAALNVSAPVEDQIQVDMTLPTGAFVINGDREYIVPTDAILAETSSDDGVGGSGVVEFRASHDGGINWTGWLPLDGTGVVEVPRPGGRGRRTVTGQFRDLAGNLSDLSTESVHLVEDAPQNLASVKKVTGVLAAGGDVDSFEVDLVAGDLLTVKGKIKPPVRGLVVLAAFDLYDPDGLPVVTNRFPETAKRAGITAFPATKTGPHLVVLRSEGADADEGGSYALTVKVKPLRANLLFEGTTTTGVIAFPAARGGTVFGTLTGNIVPPVLLDAPDELPVFLNFTTKGAVQTLSPALLNGGTGTWEVRFSQVGPVVYKLRVKPARRLVAFEAIDTAGP